MFNLFLQVDDTFFKGNDCPGILFPAGLDLFFQNLRIIATIRFTGLGFQLLCLVLLLFEPGIDLDPPGIRRFATFLGRIEPPDGVFIR